MGNLKTLTAFKLIELAKKDEAAREELFYRHERLMLKIIHPYVNNAGIDFEDLRSEAILGFYLALSKFDIEKNTKFSTYATYWIKERVFLYIKNTNRRVSIAYNKLNKMQKLKKLQNELECFDGTETEKDEIICQKMKISSFDLSELKNLLSPIISIDNAAVLQIEHDDSIEAEIEKKFVTQNLHAAMTELTEIERILIIDFYYYGKTYKEMKMETGLGYGQLKKMLTESLDKMREFLLDVGVDHW